MFCAIGPATMRLALATLAAGFFASAAARSAEHFSPGLGAWVVQWDLEAGWAEQRELGAAQSAVYVFAAHFNLNDTPYLPQPIVDWLHGGGGAGKGSLYLTVVNDVVDGEVAIEKDPDLLTRILTTRESRERHMDDLIRLLGAGPFAGLDIDYEMIKTEDLPRFALFCQELAERLIPGGFRLRVVLQPRPDILTHPLPAGIEYSVMDYNLFGGHSGPGPMADPDFIARLGALCRNAGKEARLALTAGGYVWRSGGPTVWVPENEAAALARKHNAALQRDAVSRYVTFRFRGGDGDGETEVWYADGETLAQLIGIARQQGFTGIDLWRLGDNAPGSLSRIARAVSLAGARIIRVDPDAPVTAGGLSEPMRTATLADAVAMAEHGGHIVVESGIYRENIRISQKGITITCPPGLEAEVPVTIIAPAGGPALVDTADTLWRGIAFVSEDGGEAVRLEEFNGRFEHCRFVSEAHEARAPLLRSSGGNPSFHGSVFTGRSGVGLDLSEFGEPARPGGLADFTYCLLQGFADGMADISGTRNVRFANCLMTGNGTVFVRREGHQGRVEAVNSVFFLNNASSIASSATDGPPILIDHCVYTPALNHWMYPLGPPPEQQPEIEWRNSLRASPRFAGTGGQIWVNLGIDDTMHIDVWDALSRKADRRGMKTTIAVNTAEANATAWERLADGLARGHEVASHTISHVALLDTPALTVGYGRRDADTVLLRISQERELSVEVDGHTVFRQALDENGLDMRTLARRLTTVDVAARLSPYFRGAPAVFLVPVGPLDITLGSPGIPLKLDMKNLLEHELLGSKRVIKENLPGIGDVVFVNPSADSSPMAREAIARFGYAAGRGLELPRNAEAVGGQRDETGAMRINPFSIPAYVLDVARLTDANPCAVEEIRIRLDHFKDRYLAFGLYSHGENEFSLVQWYDLLDLIHDDPQIKVATLRELAERIRTDGRSAEDGWYFYPKEAPGTDWRPKAGSPLLDAGKPLGLKSDFTGKPVPPDRAPTIGLHQADF